MNIQDLTKLDYLGKTIINKYEIETFLGNGKFGVVYKGNRLKDNEPIAIKIEIIHDYKILKHETTILNYLHEHNIKQIPTVYWYGIFMNCPTLAMTYYKNSLEDYIKHKPINHEKMDTIMGLILEILENVHKNLVIHRDIKPGNIMMKNGELFLIDFGLSTFYVDEDFIHIECKKNRDYIIGTPKYISYNIHDGYEPSRRDDLISLGYLYLDIMRIQTGNVLPWINIQHPSSNETDAPINQERKRLKSWINIESLCQESEKIYKYMENCYKLEFNELPEYKWVSETSETSETSVMSKCNE